MRISLLIKAIGFATALTVVHSSNANEDENKFDKSNLSSALSTSSDKPITASNEPTTLSSSAWEAVDRATARYPLEASMRQMSGCATVKYTLMPNNQIYNVNVVAASHKSFAKEAQNAVKSWHFETFKGSLTDKEIETQTRFQFCTNGNLDACALSNQSICTGEDVITVVSNSSDSSDDRSDGINKAVNYGVSFHVED
jgi:TonB family protein